MKKKNLATRVGIIAAITIIGLYTVLMPPVIGPNARLPRKQDFTWPGLKQNLEQNINLGLDLKGGTHLVMRVKTEEYLKKLAENDAIAVQSAAKEASFDIQEAHAEVGNSTFRVVLTAKDATKLNEIRDAVSNRVDFSLWTVSTSGNTITWTLPTTAQRQLSSQAVEQALKIMESRINAIGVAEPTLQSHGGAGSDQILLQMPGIQDPERVKQLIGSKSKLELVHVVSDPSPAQIKTYVTQEEAIQSLGGTLPPNRRVLPYAERDEPTAGAAEQNANQNAPKRWVVVEAPAIVEGNELRGAQAVTGRGGANDYQISFNLKPSGAEKFGAWTGANVNEYMGVVLDEEVKSIAYIKSQITDSGEISGRFTQQSAEDLALTLRSGALPAPIEYLEERTVGPSLGADSIRSGVRAAIAGVVFVILFMVFYYRGSGVNAVIALLLNLILTLAALIIFKATLTLPGIAGVILGIGMAVDSNVLIFERIREEWQTGKTVPSAVEQGFSRAFATIIDTHVTTIVASLFLFIFGTGPIRGFAVTLVLGLIANLFSAVYVSRTIFMWVLARKGSRVESLSI